jgi:uncharacterized protein (DUF305 family)
MTHAHIRTLAGSFLFATVMVGVPAHAQQAGSDQMKKSMESGMQSMQSMPMSGDTDKDFAMMMKVHHQQAVDMARVEAEHGKSPRLKKMAAKIIQDQTREIAQLDAWLQQHK